MLENIVSQYDADRDAGPVTWIDMHLVIAIRAMHDRIAVLEQQVQAMNEAVASGVVELDARIRAVEGGQIDIQATLSPAEFIAFEADSNLWKGKEVIDF